MRWTARLPCEPHRSRSGWWFRPVSNQDDDAAAVVSPASERGVNQGPQRRKSKCRRQRGSCERPLADPRRYPKTLRAASRFIERENGQTVAGPQHLADKMGGGFLLEADLLVGAQAGVDHDRQVQRLRSLDSNLSIFCSTPSSNSWKASLGRSGAGRFFSSRMLTRTLTRLTSIRMRPRWAAGSCGSFVGAGGVGWTIFPGSPTGDEVGEPDPDGKFEVELALAPDFGFCAQGGRSGLSGVNAIPAKRTARAASSGGE